MKIYTEIQRFTQWWVFLPESLFYIFGIYATYTLLFLKESIGNVTPEDPFFFLVFYWFTIILVFGFIHAIKLKTRIDEFGIHYQFFPVHFKFKLVKWGELEQCYVRKYSPIGDYGGWGFRISFNKGKALNIRGNMGIQLKLITGKKLLIGTQNPEKVRRIINYYYN